MSLIFSLNSSKRHSVYLGGKAEAKSRSKLEQMGITHVLNVTPEKDSSIQAGVPNYFEKKKPAKLKYRRIPVFDLPTSASDLLSRAPSIVSFISNGLHHGSVLIHCQRGVSRSATALLFYLMNRQGMTLNSALSLCQEKRPCVQPIAAFMEKLREYEEQCISKELISVVNNSAEGTRVEKRKASSVKDIAGPSKRKCAIGPALPPGFKLTQSVSEKSKHEGEHSDR